MNGGGLLSMSSALGSETRLRASFGRGCGRRAVRGKLAEVLLLEHFMRIGSQGHHLVGQPGSQGVPVRACAWQHL